MTQSRQQAIRAYYYTLFSAWGCQHWWPAQSRLEMIVGAYLTQNTAWTNVEKALENLRRARLLTLDGIRSTSRRQLEQLIRPSGYFRQKAQRLKIFIRYLDKNYGGSLSRMFARPTDQLRAELLALNGVGPETADSILLYAGNHPVFVVDAYTRRIFERHEIISPKASYEEVRELCERALTETSAPWTKTGTETETETETETATGTTTKTKTKTTANQAQSSCHRPSRISKAKRTELVQVYNDMHGLIVGVGKHYCLKSQPQCDQCPLQEFLPKAI